ncbi:hypothetical protein RhiirA4_476784 [Rhizophagus irregularis]|uniref:Uncharacterized protein n=1 Tax=Rhizophagus irregularis TaxID=588596 RepID=A0A2I1HC96_9GLOM|nr:hypothetical protein RhiirA4_476784 [Rhizophagus irregularis]
MKEKLEEDRKKYFNLTALKKWEESGEPFEEDEEILYINNQKNKACHSANLQSMGHNTEAKSAGTRRCNLANGQEQNTGNTFEFYPNKDQKTQKILDQQEFLVLSNYLNGMLNNLNELNLLRYIDRNVEVKIREFQGDELRLNSSIQVEDLVHKCFNLYTLIRTLNNYN